MSISSAFRVVAETLRTGLGRLARWLDKVLSEPPLDEKDLQRRYEAGAFFNPFEY